MRNACRLEACSDVPICVNFIISILTSAMKFALQKRYALWNTRYKGIKLRNIYRTCYGNAKINYYLLCATSSGTSSKIFRITRISEIYQRIQSSLSREFNEYKFGLSDRAVKASACDASAGRSLITGINLKSQLRSDRKKSPLGSINGGNGSLTTRGKSRRTWAINFLRLLAVLHVPPKIYHDTIDFFSSHPPRYLRLISRKSFSSGSVSFSSKLQQRKTSHEVQRCRSVDGFCSHIRGIPKLEKE